MAEPSIDERPHIVRELGLALDRHGDGLHGSAPVVPEMLVPGTGVLRTSILATWVDIVAGLLAVDRLAPRVPVTLELDTHLHRPPAGCGRIELWGQTLKAGRAVVVARVGIAADGEPIGTAAASFMAAPDATLRLPDGVHDVTANHRGGERLSAPFADRAGCRRDAPDRAVLTRSDEGLNSSNTVNGGLIALCIEEAVLSAVPAGATLSSLSMRYLRPVRVGPAVATAEVHGTFAEVEVRDAGSDDRLAVVATTRLFHQDD